ncbi:MAG: MBOAT family protein, partial [Butyrivibrio sp.]|nr:MBOAT family protein [Butyrivibrio sp.]
MIFIWLFLPLTVVCCLVLRKLPAQNILLLIVSLLFYAWGNPVHLPLLIVSIALNYVCGMLMVRARTADEADGSRTRERRVLAGGIVINLGLLTWFKYAGFILRTIGRILPVSVPQLAIALPIGISFFTFQ